MNDGLPSHEIMETPSLEIHWVDADLHDLFLEGEVHLNPLIDGPYGKEVSDRINDPEINLSTPTIKATERIMKKVCQRMMGSENTTFTSVVDVLRAVQEEIHESVGDRRDSYKRIPGSLRQAVIQNDLALKTDAFDKINWNPLIKPHAGAIQERVRESIATAQATIAPQKEALDAERNIVDKLVATTTRVESSTPLEDTLLLLADLQHQLSNLARKKILTDTYASIPNIPHHIGMLLKNNFPTQPANEPISPKQLIGLLSQLKEQQPQSFIEVLPMLLQLSSDGELTFARIAAIETQRSERAQKPTQAKPTYISNIRNEAAAPIHRSDKAVALSEQRLFRI